MYCIAIRPTGQHQSPGPGTVSEHHFSYEARQVIDASLLMQEEHVCLQVISPQSALSMHEFQSSFCLRGARPEVHLSMPLEGQRELPKKQILLGRRARVPPVQSVSGQLCLGVYVGVGQTERNSTSNVLASSIAILGISHQSSSKIRTTDDSQQCSVKTTTEFHEESALERLPSK
jgi:hypothetical protein